MKEVRRKYKFTIIATDVVIFTIRDSRLQVLLIKMKKFPFADCWAAPGGLVKVDESVDDAAKRHLFKKTGVKNIYLEQLYTFGSMKRDPFGRVVSVAYFALIPGVHKKLKTTREYSDINWFPIDKLPKMAYDHKEMIDYAISRLKSKIEYTNIVYSLLQEEFTLGELQQVYQIILNRKLDKRNFRRKILSLNLIKRVWRKKKGGASRPAELYMFGKRSPQIVEIL